MAWQPDYHTSAQLKAYVRIGDTDDDVQVAWAVTAGSRMVDQVAGRQFGKVDAAEDRAYRAVWDRRLDRWVCVMDDLSTASGFTLANEDSDAITDYTLMPRNAAARGRPYTHLVISESSSVVPTGDYWLTGNGVWGWAAVPDVVVQASLIQGARILKRRDSPFGVAGSPDLGFEVRLTAAADPDVRAMLRAYTRIRVAA